MFIGFNGGENENKVCNREPKKNDNRPIFDESRFLRSKSLDLDSSIYFSAISMFPVIRRA